MKDVPFYGNHEDNMHCMLAVYGSVIEYYLHKKMSWTELEGITGFSDKTAVWTVGVLPKLAAMGFDIKMVENFDYKKYQDDGSEYLKEKFSKEEYDWYLKNSNILKMRTHIAEFLDKIKYENKVPQLKDINEFLKEDRLVFVTVNHRILLGKKGFASHALLVISKQGESYVVHDPGNPPKPNSVIKADLLWDAMGGKNNTAEVTGFKLKEENARADVIVSNAYPLYSRSSLTKLFSLGKVLFKGSIIKPGTRLPISSKLEVDISSLENPVNEIEVPVIYEDENCIVMNKPAGLLSHSPGSVDMEPSVASFLRQKVATLSGQRGGIVHRLDRSTSGVIIGAKNSKTLSFLQKQFADRKVSKTYRAIATGHLEPEAAVIDMPIERNPKRPSTFRVGVNGKPAKTQYEVIKSGERNDLVELKPETGRTHQLRVHLAKLGHPILGDSLYNAKGENADRLYLHAYSLEIVLPDKKKHTFKAPMPKKFNDSL